MMQLEILDDPVHIEHLGSDWGVAIWDDVDDEHGFILSPRDARRLHALLDEALIQL